MLNAKHMQPAEQTPGTSLLDALLPPFQPQDHVCSTELDSATLEDGSDETSARFKLKSKYEAWRHLNINDYMPLGSLTVVSNRSASLNDRWKELIGRTVPVIAEPLRSTLYILLQAEWIRIFIRKHQSNHNLAVIRIYVLPDDVGRRHLPRHEGKPRRALTHLTYSVDRSENAWNGLGSLNGPSDTYKLKNLEDDSLFYIFNTLSSPEPCPSRISDSYSKHAVEGLLRSPPSVPGLRSRLYPYQQRSAAIMIEREAQPIRALDPRLEKRTNPIGEPFYHDQETGLLLREKKEYEEARGGVLAETMGFGKTLICLAVILATKGHWPQIPPEHSLGLHPIRSKVATLMQMVAATAGRMQIPWKAHFDLLADSGEDYDSCITALKENIGSYTIAGREPRSGRRALSIPQGETIYLCPATLVIVPPNLIVQWQHEISLHTGENALKVLVIESFDQKVPSSSELLQCDIILFSRPRFEREVISTETGVRKEAKCSWACDDDHCSCFIPYRSPLRNLHFLRIIVDEGHNFASASSKSNAIHVLQNLHVERRWIVSGTPASGLLGIEVGLAAHETLAAGESSKSLSREHGLISRRKDIILAQERKDLEKLGYIVTDFLALKPWANQRSSEDHASWQTYMMPTKDGQRKFKSLKSTLESLVVRHRIEDIEVDLQLPPLHNRVVYLQPCFLDKLSINLFIVMLTANAVTSERVDRDYMFHPQNRTQLDHLISNLRQSGFYWTGFTSRDVKETLRVSRAYLDKEERKQDESDRALLEKAIEMGTISLTASSWERLSELNEIGLYVENFPQEAQETWSLCPDGDFKHLLIGATQLGLAQKHVNEHLYAPDPASGLAAAGIVAMEQAWSTAEKRSVAKAESTSPVKISRLGLVEKTGIPQSSLMDAPMVKNRHTKSRIEVPCHQTRKGDKDFSQQAGTFPEPSSSLKPALKQSPPSTLPSLSPDSRLTEARLIGTASAKLSYLLDQVNALHRDEKILIFYEGDHIAFYIAQALEILGVQHLIYTSSLTTARRSAYMTTFNTTESFRVMIMDLCQAAHGLHIACASRVFFVNPVWQPNIEAQAIKRAHRIGQTRPVYVETLVLRDTLEDQMLQRRKAMTNREHQKAQRSLLDDSPMSDIIRSAEFIPITMNEIENFGNQMALLETPQQLFGQTRSFQTNADPDTDLIFPDGFSDPTLTAPKGKRKAVFALEGQVEPEINRSTPFWESTPSETQINPVTFRDTKGVLMTTSKNNRKKSRKVARFDNIGESQPPGTFRSVLGLPDPVLEIS